MDPVFFSPRAPRQRLHRPRPSRAALDWRFPTPLGSFFRREETEAAPHHPSSWSSKRPASQAVWKLRQYPPCGRGRDREPSARTVPGRVPRERDALPRALRGGIQGGVLNGDRGSRSSTSLPLCCFGGDQRWVEILHNSPAVHNSLHRAECLVHGESAKAWYEGSGLGGSLSSGARNLFPPSLCDALAQGRSPRSSLGSLPIAPWNGR